MAVQIQSFKKVVPMIYAYNTPGISYHDGWTKVGYTEKQDVTKRINQQTHTADVRWVLAWKDNAMYKDGSGEYFTDHDFHDYLETGAGKGMVSGRRKSAADLFSAIRQQNSQNTDRRLHL